MVFGTHFDTLYCDNSQAYNYGSLGMCDYPDNILNAFEEKVSLEGDTYTLNEDFTITDDTYFPLKISDGKTFDGNNYIITYDGTSEWGGLFEPLSGPDSDTHTNFTIKNIKFELKQNIKTNCGAIVSYYYNSSSDKFEYCDITIENCHLSGSGEIAGENAGGIAGNAFGRYSNCNIQYCSNSLDISEDYAGGICGKNAGNKEGILIIEYCWNEGEISGYYTGGICGGRFGHNNMDKTSHYTLLL